jgi:predicted nucleic acid-binding protein
MKKVFDFNEIESDEYKKLIESLRSYPNGISDRIMLANIILKKEGIESEDI